MIIIEIGLFGKTPDITNLKTTLVESGGVREQFDYLKGSSGTPFDVPS